MNFPGQQPKKKKGLGARIRGIVRRKKRKSKNGTDGGESVGSHDVSIYSYDEGGLQQQQPQQHDYYESEGMEVQPLNDLPNSALDPNIMSRIVEETSEEEEEDDDDDDDDSQSAGRPVKAKSNHMISKKARELPMDRMIMNDDEMVSKGPETRGKTSTAAAIPPASISSTGDSMAAGPLFLVLLLVDPTTLRFELLQLEFATPRDATVEEVLEQIQDPFWRPLPFVGVVDRQGNAYKVKKQSSQPTKRSSSSSPKKLKFLGGGGKKQPEPPKKVGPFLDQACQHRPPRPSPFEPHRDVLVGLLKNTSIEKMHQLARPILGEAKVVAVLEENGYSLDGWKQDKQREATLQESRSGLSNTPDKKSQWQSMPSSLRLLILLSVLAAAIVAGMKSGKVLPKSFVDVAQLLKRQKTTLHSNDTSSGTGVEKVKPASTPPVLVMGGGDEFTESENEL